MSEQQKMDQERARVVDAMCLTWRHDFGLDKRPDEFGSSGMTDDERNALRRQMGQLYDHHIARIADAASLPVGVPDGYALVPVEPTEEMQDAGVPVMPTVDCHPYDAGMVYKAMLAAAPAAQPAAQPAADPWAPSGAEYDRAIHSNPDAKAWADMFVATFPGLADKHDLMLGWFANAMMAMHDWLKSQPAAEQSAPGEVEEVEVVAWRTNRDEDGTFPRLHKTEQEAKRWVDICNVAPAVTHEPLMTVAQCRRIVAQLAARDAGVVRVPVELLRSVCSNLPEKMKPARRELRALLAQRERGGE